jgi:exodeoxyribonuclease-1
MNFVFYDLETTGRSSTWDQIIQVGATLVNDDLQILDRYEARCSLRPGVIPEPAALLINKTTPLMLKQTNLSHFGLVQQMKETFEKWSPAMFIGYNNLSFDDEFVRKTFFKCLTDVYLTNTNGNKRGDILGLVRSAHLYYPECLKTPTSEKGNAVFKLDQIASMNGISHDNAHDAMGDVLATIGMAKIIADKAPSVWKASLMTMSKQDVGNIVQMKNCFVLMNIFMGKQDPLLLSFVCNHPVYNWPQCFDLKNDPEDYFNMDMSVLKEALKKSPKIVRSVKDNKHPIIMNPNYAVNFDTYKQIGITKLNERAEKIKNNADLERKFQLFYKKRLKKNKI